MNLNTIKIGDKDSLGRTIKKIFIRSEDENKEVKYLIYETEDGILRFDVLKEFAIKRLKYAQQFEDIIVFFERDNSLRKKYNPVIANILGKVFESDGKEDLNLAFEKVKKSIENNMFSSIKLKYLSHCLQFIFYTILIILLFWFYETRIAGICIFKHFNSLLIRTLYIAGAGAIGGFISISTQLDKLKIDPFLPNNQTYFYAYTRMFLAMIFGVLIYWFLHANFISIIDVDKINFKTTNSKYLALSIAVIFGYSERLIPNIIKSKEGEYSK